ncbi:MAG: hydrolase [Waddliaceae bacterium]
MDPYSSHLNEIDEQKKSLVSLLINWAGIHSGSDNLNGLDEMLAALQEAFFVLGGKMELLTLENRKRLNTNGEITETPLGKALSITKNPEAPIQILLAGHMDIAFPTELPLEKEPRVDKEILCGRGTCDMKGGLLVMLTALKILDKSPFGEKVGWRVLITPDEELGSPGSWKLLTQMAKKYNLGLLFEPSLPDGSLVSARKGSANYSVAIRGKAAHAGRAFHQGHNALTSAARFILATESLTNLKEGTTLNIGYLEGGGPVNIVPDKAFCRFNVRVKSAPDLQMVKEKLEKIAEIENNREGISLILHEDNERPPKIFDKKVRALFEALRLSAMHLGFDLDWKATGGVCDGNTLAGAGLPSIDTLGVVGGNIHTSEEYVIIDSLVERSKLTARFLMQIATGEVNI